MEIWKDIQGYKNRYQVSNHGKVRSLKRNNILKPEIKNDGYLRVCLYANGKKKHKRINRLVARAFIENQNNKSQVNHKDGNKKNNHVSNLEWMTDKENKKHSVKNGLNAYGERNGKSKLKKDDILKIRKKIKNQESIKLIAIQFNVSITTIYRIKNKNGWNHV